MQATKTTLLRVAMLRAIFHYKLRRHARQLCRLIFPKGYDGEFFLCGGAFKPLLRKGLPVNDLDLWVRNRKEREKLCVALLERGAVLLHDFHPFCMKFRLDGQLIEITYHNVKDGGINDILNTFDLAVCGMGAHYKGGKVDSVFVSEDCWTSIQQRQLFVLEAYMCLLALEKTPSLLRTLHRMGQAAAELGYDVHLENEHRLWDLYWELYSEEERRAARDLYFDTMVSYKGQKNEHLMRRATVGYVPVDLTPEEIPPSIARLKTKAA